MLEINFRNAGEGRPPHRIGDGLSFVVRYAAPGHPCAPRSVTCEKYCLSKSSALNFCIVLRNLGGDPMEVLQLIHGQSDAVLDGRDLEEAIDRQRVRLEADAVPPWR